MKNLEANFEKFFGIPVPARMRFDETLIPVQPTEMLSFERLPETSRDEALFFVSETVNFLPLISLWLHFFHSAPDGYYMIGFHDPGFHNFYFYYARVDAWRRIYLRLNYGGVYVDDEAERTRVKDFLERYFAFEAKLEGKVKHLEFELSPDGMKYRIALTDERAFSGGARPSQTLLENPDFEGEFRELLRALDRPDAMF